MFSTLEWYFLQETLIDKRVPSATKKLVYNLSSEIYVLNNKYDKAVIQNEHLVDRVLRAVGIARGVFMDNIFRELNEHEKAKFKSEVAIDLLVKKENDTGHLNNNMFCIFLCCLTRVLLK